MKIALKDSPFDATSDTDKRPPASVEETLQRTIRVDLTEIDCIDINSALKIIAEIGLDMSGWK